MYEQIVANEALMNCVKRRRYYTPFTRYTTGCQTGLTTGLTTGCIV